MNNPNLSDQLRFSDAEARILAQFEGDQDIYDYIQWLTVGADMTVEEYEEEIDSLESQVADLEFSVRVLEDENIILDNRLEDVRFELDKAEEQIKKLEERQEEE